MQRDGTVLYTTDGNIWTAGDTPERPPFMEDDPPGNFSLNDVAFGKFSEGWAVGQFGDIIHNKDGGPTWTLQRTTANDRLTSVDMKFAPLGWAVGQGGVTQRTINVVNIGGCTRQKRTTISTPFHLLPSGKDGQRVRLALSSGQLMVALRGSLY